MSGLEIEPPGGGNSDTGLRRYTLDELLAQCNPKASRGREEREWLDAKPVGLELI